ASPLFRIPDSGGTVSPVTKLDTSRHENSHRWPVLLPDGRHFLYYARSRQKEDRAIFVGSLDSKDTRFLMSGSSNVAFAPSSPGASAGYLLFEREGSLVARKLDVAGLRFEGDPSPTFQKGEASDQFNTAYVTFSATVILAFGRWN